MPQSSEIFEFMSDKFSCDLLHQCKVEGTNYAKLTDMTQKQYYLRLLKAKELGLVRRGRDGKYYITTLGNAMLNYASFLGEILALEWMLKSVDAQQDETVRKNLIKELFSARPDIRKLINH